MAAVAAVKAAGPAADVAAVTAGLLAVAAAGSPAVSGSPARTTDRRAEAVTAAAG